MATREEYAALAFAVYNDVRSLKNKVARPREWGIVEQKQSPGFTASAYQKDNQIVISFKGTDVSGISNLVSDWYTNVTAVAGLTALRVKFIRPPNSPLESSVKILVRTSYLLATHSAGALPP